VPAEQARPAPMVILLHMYRSDRSAWRPLAGPLHDAGLAVLAIDMRGHGESATPETSKAVIARDPAVFAAMTRDVRAAYTWLAAQEGVDASRFALIGASVGCSVALRYTADDPSVDCVVCLSPGLNYLGLDSTADIKRIKGRPLWLVAASDRRERQGADGLAPLCPEATKTLYPGSLHGTRMFGRIPGIEQRVVKFVSQNIGPRSGQPVFAGFGGKLYYPSREAALKAIKAEDLRVLSGPEEARRRGLQRAKGMRRD